jgi:uncharacterized protein YukE
MYGNPDELDRLAKQIDQHADEVRKRGADIVAKAAAMQWKSAAADACRRAIGEDRAKLDAVADRLNTAAAALRKHAQEVREKIAEIGRIEHAVTGWFHDQLTNLQRVGHGVESGVRHVLGTSGSSEAPWASWPHQPGNLPPSGDKAWLDVGSFLRKQGVL